MPETAVQPVSALYVDVALGVPQNEPYQYAVPAALASAVAIGKRVKVPLRAQTKYGYVVGVSREAFAASPGRIKEILEVTDSEPMLGATLLSLTKWLSEYYFCSWGQAIEAAMPAPFKKGKTVMKPRAPKPGGPARTFEHATPDTNVLTTHQRAVYDRIAAALDARVHRTFLLHGVTGSGKTEVYLRLIQKAVAEGRGAIVLVPEISLTPQTVDRFESRFEGRIAVIHSRLTAARRLEAWHRIRRGEAQVVVGARSAVFSPVRGLGLVVIDEEHDDSYKQDETPRYDAWLVAERRCELEGAVLLRGSATPRLESFQAAKEGRAELVKLEERIGGRPMPAVRIVDMRNQVAGRSLRIFSLPLESAVREALDNKEQVMLFLNRRGFAPYISCLTCGHVVTCPRCRVSMVFHFEEQELLCHACNHASRPPKLCPACSKGYLRYLGMGTEKVESEAQRLFPGARVARMDTDTMQKTGAHEKVLSAFRRKEIDILLGTQMIAKGHDFPGVSVIGVISADTALHLPDFRSAERTFDLLTQVAGRAGREDVPGNVFVQTFVPTHYAIVAAKDHDYAEFYDTEIRFREELKLPPFRHMAQIYVGARDERLVVRRALEFKRHTEEEAAARDIDILGPAPCIVSKRRGFFMWNLFYKGADAAGTAALLRERLSCFRREGVLFTVDVDPR